MIYENASKAELVKLRDIGIFNDVENELNKMGYYNDEEQSNRLSKLKEYYKIK